MQAYELNAAVTEDGQIEWPTFQLPPKLPYPPTVKVFILVPESDESNDALPDVEENFSEESFKRSWQQAISSDVVPFNLDKLHSD